RRNPLQRIQLRGGVRGRVRADDPCARHGRGKERRRAQGPREPGERPVKIEVRSVSKRFGSFAALSDVNLTVDSGELVALLGPSGSGKTSLLRVIAGLEPLDQGAVLFGGRDATERSARERNVGFVFQHYALFRHMTVFENIAFGLRVRKKNSADVTKKVRELLHLVRLERMEHRYPSQLSGGQRQRVAL